jgi:hypothetical protein
MTSSHAEGWARSYGADLDALFAANTFVLVLKTDILINTPVFLECNSIQKKLVANGLVARRKVRINLNGARNRSLVYITIPTTRTHQLQTKLQCGLR